MKLTYEVHGNGYTIFNDGKAWITQDSYIPFPADTLEESAQLHIANLIENDNMQHQPSQEEEISQLKQKTQELEFALVEMSTYAAMQEQRNIQNEQAILELTTMIAGGNA